VVDEINAERLFTHILMSSHDNPERPLMAELRHSRQAGFDTNRSFKLVLKIKIT